jgi:hypothetical protein
LPQIKGHLYRNAAKRIFACRYFYKNSGKTKYERNRAGENKGRKRGREREGLPVEEVDKKI